MSFSEVTDTPSPVSQSISQTIICIPFDESCQVEIFENAVSMFLRFCNRSDVSVQVGSLDSIAIRSGAVTVIASTEMRSVVKEGINLHPLKESSKTFAPEGLCTFFDRMGWCVQKTWHDDSDCSIAICDRLKEHHFITQNPNSVWVYVGSPEFVQANRTSWLPAIEQGKRILFITNTDAEQLRLDLLAAEIDLSQSHIYIAELTPSHDNLLVHEVLDTYVQQYGVVPNGLFWDLLAALDTATNPNIGVSQFTPKFQLIRCDLDGLSSVSFEADHPKATVARDFAAILTARQILMKKTGQTLDQTRNAAGRWVKNFSGSISESVEISRRNQYLHIYTPPNATGKHLIYLHGGGLVYYDLDVFAPLMSHLAVSTGLTVLAFGYDKLPETAVETVLDELFARMQENLPDSQEPFIMGDSIGGLLALYAAIHLFPSTFCKAVLLYPVLSFNQTYPSYEAYGENHLLDASIMRWFRSMCSPYFKQRGFDPMKLEKRDLTGLQISVFSAGCDVLADEADAFAKQVSVNHCRFTNMPHDFCLYRGKMTSTHDPIAAVINTLIEV